MPPFLEVINLTKYYKQAAAPALDSLSFSMEKGDVFGLLGPNGAGKTTAISILSGWLNHYQGIVKIDGMKLNRQAANIKKIIGIVPQDIALYPTLTARENLLYFGRIFGLRGVELKNRVDSALELLGVKSNADKQIQAFSGGMKRRANLIAGILHKPQLLFLDEPTVGIDVQSKAAILDYLKELNKQGMTILYTSHHLAEAEQICNKVAIIDVGIKILEGKPTELVEQISGANNLEDVFIKITGKELRD